MTVCRQKGITRIYAPIWVALNEAKYSPALLEAAIFHVFIFDVPQNVPRRCTDYSVLCGLIGQKDTAQETFQRRV